MKGPRIGQHVQIYTYILPGGSWKLYDALILQVRRCSIDAILVDDNAGIHVERNVEHFMTRTSAHYWKFPEEPVDDEQQRSYHFKEEA